MQTFFSGMKVVDGRPTVAVVQSSSKAVLGGDFAHQSQSGQNIGNVVNSSHFVSQLLAVVFVLSAQEHFSGPLQANGLQQIWRNELWQ